MGTGLLDRAVHVERARDSISFRGGWRRRQPRLRRHRDRYYVHTDQEPPHPEFRHSRAGRRDRHEGRSRKLACGSAHAVSAAPTPVTALLRVRRIQSSAAEACATNAAVNDATETVAICAAVRLARTRRAGTKIRRIVAMDSPMANALIIHYNRTLLIPHDNMKAGWCEPNRFGISRKLPAALEANLARIGTGLAAPAPA